MAAMRTTKVASIDAFVTPPEDIACDAARQLSTKQIARADLITRLVSTTARIRRVTLAEAERKQLEHWAHGRTTPLRLALRSRIVLLAASGLSLRQVAVASRTSLRTVILWRNRFVRCGIQSLLGDAPGRGRKPSIAREVVQAIAAERTPDGKEGTATVRSTALKFGVSRSTVQRIWSKISRDESNSGTRHRSNDRRS
jgi:hypothetical protein